jgi:hypothetical protein
VLLHEALDFLEVQLMKTTDLTGPALDWAVAKCEGAANIRFDGNHTRIGTGEHFDPSTNWSQGGPIIEKEGISMLCTNMATLAEWQATYNNPWVKGPTPLVAAMRCYVASKLGDEVEIPEGLQND